MKLLVSAAAVAVAVALVVGSCCTSTSTASPSPSFSPSFPRTNIAYSPITRPSFGQPLNLTLSSGGWGTEDEDSLVESLLQLGNNNRRGSALPHEIAFEFAANHLLLPRNSFSSESSTDPALLRQLLALHSSYTTAHNNLTHIHLQQTLDGVPIANAVANININSETGEIVSFGSSLFPINEVVMSLLSKSTPSTTHGPHLPSLFSSFVNYYTKNPDAHLILDHEEQIRNSLGGDVNGGDGRILISPTYALGKLAQFIHIEMDETKLLQIPLLTVEAYRGDRVHAVGVSPAFMLENVPFTLSGSVPARLTYIQVVNPVDGSIDLRLVWDLEVEMDDNWYHAHIDTQDSTIHSLIDWVSDASYNVFPLGTNDPLSGPRQLVINPEHPRASPNGWHSQKDKNFTTTVGNNVYAHENLDGKYTWEDNYRPDGGVALLFDFPYNATKEPSTYVDAAVTNLFYWNNMIHDLFYMYGFDEVAGNFQQSNGDKGGAGGDAVIANAQDGSGYNNANFATPPDGQHGKMRMYVWDRTVPKRDGDLEGGIVVHEYAHGISIRLTGGPANSGCLGWGESGGMGEGWGDFFATLLRHNISTKRTDDFSMGEYANGGHGIRRYVYSSNMTTNPSTYNYITKPGYWGVHAKGEVWAVILLEVYWELVDNYGFDPDWFNVYPEDTETLSNTYLDLKTGRRLPRTTRLGNKAKSINNNSNNKKHRGDREKGLHGNQLALQLVVDGLKLQPCYPTFVSARDAILQADVSGFGGAHICDIWRAFAKRGLGFGARAGGRESFTVPRKCRDPAKKKDDAEKEKKQQDEDVLFNDL